MFAFRGHIVPAVSHVARSVGWALTAAGEPNVWGVQISLGVWWQVISASPSHALSFNIISNEGDVGSPFLWLLVDLEVVLDSAGERGVTCLPPQTLSVTLLDQ